MPALVANMGLYFLVFRVLSPKDVASRDLIPGVVFAALGWQILQTVGVNLVGHQLRHSSQVYGVFGVTIALLSFLYMAAELTVYGAEINVVKSRRLWPRSVVQPPLTPSDQRVLRDIAVREERRPEQQVKVGFDLSQHRGRINRRLSAPSGAALSHPLRQPSASDVA